MLTVILGCHVVPDARRIAELSNRARSALAKASSALDELRDALVRLDERTEVEEKQRRPTRLGPLQEQCCKHILLAGGGPEQDWIAAQAVADALDIELSRVTRSLNDCVERDILEADAGAYRLTGHGGGLLSG